MSRNLFILAFATIAASWAAPLIRLCHSDPLVIAAYRMIFASLILLPVYLSQRERIVLPRGHERWLVALAGAFLAGHFAVWITALTLTSVSSATVLVTVQPLFLTVLAHVILKERVDKWGYLAIVLALTGAALISWGDFRLSEGHLVGDLLALSGAILAAFYLLIGRTLVGKLGTINYTMPLYATSALLLTVMMFIFGKTHLPGQTHDYFWFVLLAFVPTLLGHSLYNYSLKHFKAHLVGTMNLGEPIMASVWALMLFGESPTLMTVLGAALIFAAIAFSFGHERKVSP
ncbi:MAG: DMT family transporter [candidate division Zixibacteria bacterium]|nr:DMT family transporter [candidate division Zixibacteria bacterium]